MDELEKTRGFLNRALGALEVLGRESRSAQDLQGDIREFLDRRDRSDKVWEMKVGQA